MTLYIVDVARPRFVGHFALNTIERNACVAASTQDLVMRASLMRNKSGLYSDDMYTLVVTAADSDASPCLKGELNGPGPTVRERSRSSKFSCDPILHQDEDLPSHLRLSLILALVNLRHLRD